MRAIRPANWWVDAEWPVWRLVLDEKASLGEIDAHWSISDVLDANEALDVANDIAHLRRQVRPPKAHTPKPGPKPNVARSAIPRPPRR